jgi:hypothetical protein
MTLEDIDYELKHVNKVSQSRYDYLRRQISLTIKGCKKTLGVINYIPYPTEDYTGGDRVANLVYILDTIYKEN